MNEELKLCPFCGNKPTHKIGEIEMPESVFCLTCNIAIPTEIWQKREIEDLLNMKLEGIYGDFKEYGC